MSSFGGVMSGLGGSTGGGALSSAVGNGSNAGFNQGLSGTLDSSQLQGELSPLAAQQGQNSAAAVLPGFNKLTNAFMQNGQYQVNNTGFNQAVNGFNNANNATMSGIGNQNQVLQLAMQAAQGNGPSVSNAQMNAALANAQANANSMAASNINAGGLGLRDAMMAGAAAQGQAAGQGAIARATEQLGNIQNVGNVANALTNNAINNQNSYTNLAGAQTGQANAITSGLNASTNAINGASNVANNQLNGNLTAAQLNSALTGQGSNQIQQYNNNQAQGFTNALSNVGNIMSLGGKGIGSAASIIGAM